MYSSRRLSSSCGLQANRPISARLFNPWAKISHALGLAWSCRSLRSEILLAKSTRLLALEKRLATCFFSISPTSSARWEFPIIIGATSQPLPTNNREFSAAIRWLSKRHSLSLSSIEQKLELAAKWSRERVVITRCEAWHGFVGKSFYRNSCGRRGR